MPDETATRVGAMPVGSSLQASLSEIALRSLWDNVRPKSPQMPPHEIAAILPLRLQALDATHQFKRGQLVQWKAGLKNRLRPDYETPAIVVDLPTKAEIDDGDIIDIYLGVITEDNGFVIFGFDKRRLEPYSPKGT